MSKLLVGGPGDKPEAGGSTVFLMDEGAYAPEYFRAHFDDVVLGPSVERVPNKNVRPFCGKPLYHHIIDTLDRTYAVDEVVINNRQRTYRARGARSIPEGPHP